VTEIIEVILMVLLKMGLNREIGNIPGIENKSPSLNG
jgi:hypothetical protein